MPKTRNQFIPKYAIKTFVVSVLPWAAWLDEMRRHALRIEPIGDLCVMNSAPLSLFKHPGVTRCEHKRCSTRTTSLAVMERAQ